MSRWGDDGFVALNTSTPVATYRIEDSGDIIIGRCEMHVVLLGAKIWGRRHREDRSLIV